MNLNLGYGPYAASQEVFTGAGLAIYAPDPVNLYGTTYVDVAVNFNTGCLHTSPTRLNLIARVYITAGYGSLQTWTQTIVDPNNVFQVTGQEILQMRITLYDAWGDVISLPSSADVSLVFVLKRLNANE